MFDAILLALTATVASGPAAEAPPSPPVAATAASPQQRYCVVSGVTGSIIQKRECHTRAEWLALGFDPLAKK